MWNLLQYLFIGHVHDYEIIQHITYVDGDDTSGVPRARGLLLKCKTCGKIKQKVIHYY